MERHDSGKLARVEGSTLHSAMELHPEIFDDYFVNLFQAGEVCEMYDSVLPRFAG